MSMPGFWEMMLIFLVVLLVFGAKRIPEIARGLGKGIREFKDATSEITKELNVNDTSRNRIEQPRPPAHAPTPRADVGQQEQAPAEPRQAANPSPSESERAG